MKKYIQNAIIFLYIVLSTFDQVNGRFGHNWPYASPIGSGGDSGSSEAPKCPDPALPAPSQQDKDDAANIVNHQFDEKVIASVLPFRSLEHRKIINIEIANLSNGKLFIQQKYKPIHKDPPFKDLSFSLTNYPITVLAMYLGEFLHRKDETYIIMVLTLCQNMQQLTCIYNRNHKNSLKKRRKKQRHPFSNLMRVWVARDRDPEDSKFTDADINKDVESLKKEYPHWNEDRDSLENTLIRKCLKFSLAVVQKFESDLKISIEDAIKQKIKNHDLVDAYTSLALYVKNKYHYMAKTLLERCNNTYNWAIWIMYVGFIDSKDWPKIDDEFKKINNGISLRDHILKNPEPDKILLQVMAVMIDPNYKPDLLVPATPPNINV